MIREHHTSVGRDPFLTKSIIGSNPPEGYPPRGIWVEDMSFDDDIVDDNPNVVGNDVVGDNVADIQREDSFGNAYTPLDQYHDVQRQVMEALDRGDALHREFTDEPDMDVYDDIDSDTM